MSSIQKNNITSLNYNFCQKYTKIVQKTCLLCLDAYIIAFSIKKLTIYFNNLYMYFGNVGVSCITSLMSYTTKILPNQIILQLFFLHDTHNCMY